MVETDGLKDIFPSSADGKRLDELEAIGGNIYAFPLDDDPQESLDHLVERVRSTTQVVLSEAAARNYSSVGLVSHGDTLSAIDWVLRHTASPTSYDEMKNDFYLQKAEACGYTLDEQSRLLSEGRIIRVGLVSQSLEAFRG